MFIHSFIHSFIYLCAGKFYRLQEKGQLLDGLAGEEEESDEDFPNSGDDVDEAASSLHQLQCKQSDSDSDQEKVSSFTLFDSKGWTFLLVCTQIKVCDW